MYCSLIKNLLQVFSPKFLSFAGQDEPNAAEDCSAFEGVSEHERDADDLQRGRHELRYGT